MTTILTAAFAFIFALGGFVNPAQANPTHEIGQASWYAIRCNGGTATASGKPLVDNASTAAHKKLPMGTKVKVTNLNNGKHEVVTITDRGPYAKGRIIDVTVGVAKRIGFHKNGVAKVKVEVIK